MTMKKNTPHGAVADVDVEPHGIFATEDMVAGLPTKKAQLWFHIK